MLIDKLLSGAVRLWLKSQVSAIDNLKIKIIGKDRQILQGCIPEVCVSANNAVYQGLHISELRIKGTNINFNLPQVLKRKPLQLLEPIIVEIKVSLQETDLQNSLSSPLLAAGLTDMWNRFLCDNQEKSAQNPENYQWEHLYLSESVISFDGTYSKQENDNYPLGITTSIKLNDSHSLLLSPRKITTISELPITNTESLMLDLGTQVSIAHFDLTSNHLLLKGTITVFP
ncbi:conserved hypothetical protein [Hyella patelloides LEGE 07179]|uniref:DUF2993 domain-containing protein n=1 Tax=Hyella patelloides LEGE 07179 TaxID=945734 RepID=A0A563VNG6_9CYAN|nr:DUF2993 domain-containing protein [Hyella patelloides]VEP12952.1 conserved hypothetical protein [Hyella patelloides LEGE 07179]